MTAVFLPSPFDRAPLLDLLVADRAASTRAATLAGHAVVTEEHGVETGLVAGEGAVAGQLARLTAADADRVAFVFSAFGADPVSVAVETAEGMETATAHVFAPEVAPRGRLDPASEQEARLAEALEEMLGQYGLRPPAEMRGVLYGIGVRALGRSRGARRDVAPALGVTHGRADVVPLVVRRPYLRYFALEEHRLRHRRFDGAMSDVLERAVFTSGDAVVVLPYDPLRDRVLLIQQFRAGPWARRDPRPWCIETVAGRCDMTESTEETARREAREEAGLDLGRVEQIGTFYPSPAIMTEFITNFVGEADLGGAAGTFGLADEHEDIRTLIVSRADAMAAMGRGEIATAPVMLALYWLEQNAARLRADWGGAR